MSTAFVPPEVTQHLPDDTQLPIPDGVHPDDVPEEIKQPWPDDTQLPDSDGKFVKNFQEHPQSVLLTDSIQPLLKRLYPDGQYCIGQDSGIYYRPDGDPPESGAIAPDWYFVPGASPKLGGRLRRSYIMWRELIHPLIALEFVSGDGSEERDRTPNTGKFWIYEQVLRPGFYGIYEVSSGLIEMYHSFEGRLERMTANERGRYPIAPWGIELGIWKGFFINQELPWLRWWDAQGNLLLTGHELAEQERQRAEQEKQRNERLAARLRALGVDPNEV